MKGFIRKNGLTLLVAFLCVLTPELALAAGGADTAATSGNNLKTWMDTWIPIGCTIAVIGLFLGRLIHIVPASFMFNASISLIGIGSASYIIQSIFGIGS